MLQVTHEWKATFFLFSGAWLRRREKGRWESNGQYSNPALAWHTMWGLCALVDQHTERPFSWSNCFSSPTPAFLCTLITQQAHAYSRANHVTSAETPCKVIKTVEEHVIKVDQHKERTLIVWRLHNTVSQSRLNVLCWYVLLWPKGFLLCPSMS